MNKMLVVSDIDGTLLNSEEHGGMLEAEIKETIKEFVAAGNIFTVATGRPDRTAGPVVTGLDLEVPYIINNGAKIVDTSGNVIYENDFHIQEVKDLVAACAAVGATVIIEKEGHMYCIERTADVEHFEHKECAACHEMGMAMLDEDLRICKVLVVGNVAQYKEIWLTQNEEVKCKFRYIISEDNYFEIVKGNVSKGDALNKLRAYLGIPKENVYSVGNHLNDKELLEEAYRGFAVANAKDELKDMAYKVTSKPYGYGVMEVIEEATNA